MDQKNTNQINTQQINASFWDFKNKKVYTNKGEKIKDFIVGVCIGIILHLLFYVTYFLVINLSNPLKSTPFFIIYGFLIFIFISLMKLSVLLLSGSFYILIPGLLVLSLLVYLMRFFSKRQYIRKGIYLYFVAIVIIGVVLTIGGLMMFA
ncbi:MAG: hypothetical protein NTZ97_00855 [Candidatus Moranbacteria bacterium]|nr:hypothetical protein [Candidatus Moranbacteria bacterium]